MTKPELKSILEQLKQAAQSDETDNTHAQADDLLLEALQASVKERWTLSQAKQVVNAYQRVIKSFA